MKTIIENGRTYYQCDICHITGTDSSVIEAGYCHKKTRASHHGDIETATKKKEQKHRVKGMSRISVKKFNSYIE